MRGMRTRELFGLWLLGDNGECKMGNGGNDVQCKTKRPRWRPTMTREIDEQLIQVIAEGIERIQ